MNIKKSGGRIFGGDIVSGRGKSFEYGDPETDGGV